MWYNLSGDLMKKLLILLAIILLTGCTSVNNVQKELNDSIDRALTVESGKANNSKTYFSYYLEPSVGKVSTTQTSSVLQLNETTFVMNLNIAKIVNAMNYGDIIPSTIELDEEYIVARKKGTYYDNDMSEYPYEVVLFEVRDKYYLTVDTHYVTFYASGSWAELDRILEESMKIAKSITINVDEIKMAYSAKERISFEKEVVTLITEVVPVEGKVDDMVNGTTSDEVVIDIVSDADYRTDNLDY